MSRLYAKMISGATGPIKSWAAAGPAAHVWADASVSGRYTTPALSEGGVSLIDAVIASGPAHSRYSLAYALSAQYAPSYYAPKGYGGHVALVALEGKGLPDDALAELRAMPEKTRPSGALLAALADGRASVPVIKLVPAFGLPTGRGAVKGSESLRAVFTAMMRAHGDDADKAQQIVEWAALYDITPADIGGKAQTGKRKTARRKAPARRKGK